MPARRISLKGNCTTIRQAEFSQAIGYDVTNACIYSVGSPSAGDKSRHIHRKRSNNTTEYTTPAGVGPGEMHSQYC